MHPNSPLKSYLFLQFHLTNRKFRDAGIGSWLAWILLALLFAGLSFCTWRVGPICGAGTI